MSFSGRADLHYTAWLHCILLRAGVPNGQHCFSVDHKTFICLSELVQILPQVDLGLGYIKSFKKRCQLAKIVKHFSAVDNFCQSTFCNHLWQHVFFSRKFASIQPDKWVFCIKLKEKNNWIFGTPALRAENLKNSKQ